MTVSKDSEDCRDTSGSPKKVTTVWKGSEDCRDISGPSIEVSHR